MLIFFSCKQLLWMQGRMILWSAWILMQLQPNPVVRHIRTVQQMKPTMASCQNSYRCTLVLSQWAEGQHVILFAASNNRQNALIIKCLPQCKVFLIKIHKVFEVVIVGMGEQGIICRIFTTLWMNVLRKLDEGLKKDDIHSFKCCQDNEVTYFWR